MSFIINPYAFGVGGFSDVTDNFDRADSTTTLGTASDGIHAWTPQVGTWGINTNQAYCPTLSSGSGVATVNYGARACTMQVTIKTLGGNWGFFMAHEGPADVIWCRYEGTFSRVKVSLLRTGFATVDLINVSGAWSANDVMKLNLAGNTVTLYKNGASIGNSTDARLADATGVDHGLFTSSTAARFDDFSITP
jgi:hypothetical protein